MSSKLMQRMVKLRRLALPVLALALPSIFFTGPSRSAEQLQWRWSDVDSVVAVADIHGDYDAFLTVLQSAELIDEDLGWTGGTTHLVIVGDVLDRGPDSRQVLDLLMDLEPAAAAAGGMVHMTLGNHELMNLIGDLRYVSSEEFAAFAGEEAEAEREQLFARFLAEHPESQDRPTLQRQFDSTYPSGFLGHVAAFAPDGVYGAWLLKQPLLVVINDTAFVHGGLSPVTVRLGGEGINTALREQIQEYVTLLQRLRQQRILQPTVNFYDHPEALETYAQRVTAAELAWPDGMAAAAERLIELNAALVFNQDSPLWYRGTVGCSPLVERERLHAALAAMPAKRVVIGHTPTASARVLSRMTGTVLRIDTGMLNAHYGGRGAALVLAGDDVQVLYEGETEPTRPLPQPRRVGMRPSNLTAAQLEGLLENGVVIDRVDGESAAQLTIEQNGIRVTAEFSPTPRSGRGFFPEVAAYRLDRELGLDMVPVAVVREIDGKAGSLRFMPPHTVTETERRAAGRGASAWCPLADQFQAMYIFDVLVFNQGRTPDSFLYDVNNWQLILVDHGRAFGSSRGRPAHLANLDLALSDAWVETLMALGSEELQATMSGVLDRKRIKALLKRRDQLLRDAAR